MSEQSVTRILLTSVGRMSHPHLITPRPYMEKGVQKGDPRYSTNLIIEEADQANFRVLNAEEERLDVCNFKDVVVEMILETWPELENAEGIKQAVKFGGLKWPIASGDKEAQKPANKKFEDAFLGKKVIRAHSNEDYPPTLKWVKDGKRVTLNPEINADQATIKRLFRSAGNYADMEVNARTSTVDGRKYVTLYLNSICFIKTGESIGRGGVSLMDMAGVEGGSSDHDPTKGLSAEIDI